MIQGVRNPGGRGGPGPPNILGKNIQKSQKKGTLKFSAHYLGPLNIYRVAHALSMRGDFRLSSASVTLNEPLNVPFNADLNEIST